jgi:hypothetical protein
MMTLNRYLLVGKDHASWLVTIAKLEFKWVIRRSLLISALINIGHGWEYQANGNLAIVRSIYDNFAIINGYSYSDYPQANQDQAYFFYSIVYFLINFGVFFILNTGIEVKIVRRMHKELQEKRERLAKMNSATKLASSTLTAIPAEAPKLLDEDKKRRKRTIKRSGE